MKRMLAAMQVVAGLMGAGGAAATPEDDRTSLVTYYRQLLPGIAPSDYVYGALSMSPDARQQYEAIMAFPPFQDQLDQGKALWERPFANGKSFARCFPDAGHNVAGNYPYFDDAAGKVVTFEMALNRCLSANGEPELKLDDMGTMGALSAYARSLSDGMPIHIKVEGPGAITAYETGKKLFYERRGQFDFSCSICHVDLAGKRVRNEYLSPAVGQATHWPVFRSPGDDLWTLQRRYVGCYKLIRAKAPPIGSEEFNDLEYFHTFLSQGLPLKAAVFRK